MGFIQLLCRLYLTCTGHIMCNGLADLTGLVALDLEPGLGTVLVSSSQIVLASTAQFNGDAGLVAVALQTQVANPAISLSLPLRLPQMHLPFSLHHLDLRRPLRPGGRPPRPRGRRLAIGGAGEAELVVGPAGGGVELGAARAGAVAVLGVREALALVLVLGARLAATTTTPPFQIDVGNISVPHFFFSLFPKEPRSGEADYELRGSIPGLKARSFSSRPSRFWVSVPERLDFSLR